MAPVRLVFQMLEIVVLAGLVEDLAHGGGVEVAAGALVDFVGRVVDGGGDGVAGGHGGEDDFGVAGGADGEFGDVRVDVPGVVVEELVAGAFGDDWGTGRLSWRSRFGGFGLPCKFFGETCEGSGVGLLVGFSGFGGYLVEYVDVLDEMLAVGS